MVLPTAYGRIGDTLYLHGSSANRSLHWRPTGSEVCVTVTHLDGLVCARAVFSHSVNYRCAVVFGTATLVTGHAERLAGLRAVTEQLIPGRWEAVRAPTRKELAATPCWPCRSPRHRSRSAPARPATNRTTSTAVWAGVVPVTATFGEPQPDPALLPGIGVPDHIRALRGSRWAAAAGKQERDRNRMRCPARPGKTPRLGG